MIVSKRAALALAAVVSAVSLLAACGGGGGESAPTATATATASAAVDTAGIKDYLLEHGNQMAESTAAIEADAEAYFAIIEGRDFDYRVAWADRREELVELLVGAKQKWILAHNDYELIEGIVAGVPSLSYYDTWIDAGPPATEAPEEAVDWVLELGDGRTLDSPGNIFHHLLETTLWGTVPDYTGQRADLDGDGEDELGEVLPEAYVFLAAAQAMNDATAEMNAAIADWEPTPEDAFTALVTMIPTMGEYFEEWKLSAFITGEDPRFVAQTRLVDIRGIGTSLNVIYSHLDPAVAARDAALAEQITSGFTDLLDFVDQVYTQEQAGAGFGPEEADALGTEAQDKAQALAALVAQAATALELELEPER
ncbi:MAG: EfeM/EfeO family lipoprotein [Thermoleophilia bacterium]|nr:EfeM/EfeO family lipoprotein [Thermoleophilia bacterium]